jgi:hypothetical protein
MVGKAQRFVAIVAGLALTAAAQESSKPKDPRWADYAALAKNVVPCLADRQLVDEAPTEPAVAEAKERWRVATLESTSSTDRRIQAVAKEAAAAHARLLEVAHENGDDMLFAAAGAVFLGNPLAVLNLVRAGSAQNNRWQRYETALQRRRAAMFMLPEIAQELAGSPRDKAITLDFDENWFGAADTPDRLNLTNESGEDLSNVTVQVDVRGVAGKWVRNVHFVESWPKGRKMWADYLSTDPRDIGALFGITAKEVQDLRVTVWCVELRTEVAQHYPDADRAADRRRQLEDHVKFTLDYVARPLIESGPCIGVTMQGVPLIPDFKVTLDCKVQGAEPVRLQGAKKGWQSGARLSLPSAGMLSAIPESVELRLEVDGLDKAITKQLKISSRR